MQCVQAAELEIKFQMIVETDVGVLCGLRVFTLVRQLSTLPARVPANNQGYICHRARYLLIRNILCYHPPTSNTDLRSSPGVFQSSEQLLSISSAGGMELKTFTKSGVNSFQIWPHIFPYQFPLVCVC